MCDFYISLQGCRDKRSKVCDHTVGVTNCNSLAPHGHKDFPPPLCLCVFTHFRRCITLHWQSIHYGGRTPNAKIFTKALVGKNCFLTRTQKTSGNFQEYCVCVKRAFM